MSLVTEVMPPCTNCKKVHSLAEQLIVNMQAFEVFTMEMELDPKSAKLKARDVISNFWKLISTIKSLEMGEKHDTENKSCDNQNSTKSNVVLNIEKHDLEIGSEENENQDEQVKSKFIPAVEKTTKMRGKQQPKPAFKRNSNPNMTSTRLHELQRAKTLLRTIKCETEDGFYNLFECLKCQRQFNDKCSSLRHVQNIHLKLGFHCPTCFNKFFNKKSLDVHIPKCSKRKHFQQIKICTKNDRKKPVKAHLYPHEKPKQADQPKTLVGKFQVQRGKPRKSLDPLKVKVNNPFPEFSLEKTQNVKVVTERLKMDKSGEILSISQ